ncbi:hypothetical protein C8Q79DRAFT_230730 [Trametes meyenii]|nr:hypothetical protein C8Q79DRAFT_230730 [Trametes meyenii]
MADSLAAQYLPVGFGCFWAFNVQAAAGASPPVHHPEHPGFYVRLDTLEYPHPETTMGFRSVCGESSRPTLTQNRPPAVSGQRIGS